MDGPKVIIPYHMNLSDLDLPMEIMKLLEDDTVGTLHVKKIWFDPQDKSSPATRSLLHGGYAPNTSGTKKPAGSHCIGPQHVVHLAICIKKTEDTASPDLNELKRIARILPNLETLEIDTHEYQNVHGEMRGLENFPLFIPIINRIAESCPKLYELSVQFDFEIVTSQVSSLVFGSSSRWPISLNQLEWISNSEKLEINEIEEWTSNFNNLQSLKLVDIFSEFALHCDLVFHNTPCISRLELCCTASERTYILHTAEGEEDELDVTKSNTLVNETDFLIRIQQLLPALETLVITQEGSRGNDRKSMPRWKISDLTNVLHAIGDVKKIIISNLTIIVENDLDEKETEIIFQEALEIIGRKYAINLTELELLDSAHNFTIVKKKTQMPILSRLLPLLDGSEAV